MGGLKNLFRKRKEEGRPCPNCAASSVVVGLNGPSTMLPPGSTPPRPLWALATEPSPSPDRERERGRRGYGPRELESPGPGLRGPRRERPPSQSPEKRMIETPPSSPTRRRPLPTPPSTGANRLQRPSGNPRTISAPPRPPTLPPTLTRPAAARSGSSSPPKLTRPNGLRSTASLSNVSISSGGNSIYAPSEWSYASTSTYNNPLYPQAIPRPPQFFPTPSYPTGPDPMIIRQTVPLNTLPPALIAGVQAIEIGRSDTPNTIAFPGAFPVTANGSDGMPVPKPYDASAWNNANNATDFIKRSNPPPVTPPRPTAPITPVSNKSKPRPPPSAVLNLCSSSAEDDDDSLPSSPTKNRCHGTTASGKQCTRLSSSSSPSPKKGKVKETHLDRLDDLLGTDLPRFCFQHSKQALLERGCFVDGQRERGQWIEFDDWIMEDLPNGTKVLLRHEMARPVSEKDEIGFIYCHEMVEKRSSSSCPSTSKSTYIKIGRSIKPISRLSQWRSQCPSREPIVRDIFPRVDSTSLSSGAGVSGALRVAEKGGRYHHRWERLILIEVAGRVGEKEKKTKEECKDCGKQHVELFRVEKGAYEDWVREIIERWERWCRDILA